MDAEYWHIVCAAFNLAPLPMEEPIANAADFYRILPVVNQIERRFAWYAEHCKSPLLPNEKRDIARAVAEAYAARRGGQ